MKTYVNTITIKVSDIQYKTLNKLRNRNIKVSNFIRDAISEKINREAKELKPKKIKQYCPF